MAVSAKVVITGQNNIGSAIKSASNDLSSLQKASQKVGETLKKAFAATAIIASLKKLGDETAKCFSAFSTASRSYRQLALAMKDDSGYQAVVSNIAKLSTMTLESKGSIESMVSELSALGKNSDEINKISDAAVALSNVTGRDLNSSMTTLLNTYNGNVTQLKKLGVETEGLTKQELASGAAVDLVIDKFYGLSEAMAEADTSQHIQNIKNTLGDIEQQIGGIVDYNFGPLAAKIDSTLQTSFSNIQNIINYTGAVIANFPAVMGEALNLVGSMLNKVFSWDFVSDLIETVFDNITTLLETFIQLIQTAIPDVLRYSLQKVSAFITNITGLAVKSAETLLSKLANAVKPVVNTIVSDFLYGIATILEKVEGAIDGISSAFKDIGNTILSDALSICAYILDKLESAIEGPLNLIARSKLGKLIGMEEIKVNFGADKLTQLSDKKLLGEGSSADLGSSALKEKSRQVLADKDSEVSFNFGGDEILKAAESLKKLSSENLDAAKEGIQTIVTSTKESLDDVKSNTDGFLDEQFGEAISTFKNSVDTIVAPDLEKINSAADATSQTTKVLATTTTNIEKTIKSGTFLDRLGEKIGSWAAGITGSTESQGTSFGSSIVSSLKENLDDAGELIGNLAKNMSTMGPTLGAIATALDYVIQGFSETFGDVLNELVGYVIEPFKELGRIVGDLLTPVLEMVMPLIEEASNILITVLDMLSAVLQPIIEVLSSVLTPILEVIGDILEMLMPVFKVFAKILVTITGTIQYVIQVFQHGIATFINWLSSISIFGWHPFGGLHMTDPGMPGSYTDFIKSKWDSIDAAFERASSTDSSSSTSTSTSTAVTSAGYQGATQVTINIYQEAPVVGDGGMRAFASMIKAQFDELSYYGVTA